MLEITGVVQLLGTGAVVAALTKGGEVVLARMNKRQAAALADKTGAEAQRAEAEAGQLIASTLLSSLVEPLKRDLEEARVDVRAVRRDLAITHRLIRTHEKWDTDRCRDASKRGDDVPSPPPLWPESDPTT